MSYFLPVDSAIVVLSAEGVLFNSRAALGFGLDLG